MACKTISPNEIVDADCESRIFVSDLLRAPAIRSNGGTSSQCRFKRRVGCTFASWKPLTPREPDDSVDAQYVAGHFSQNYIGLVRHPINSS